MSDASPNHDDASSSQPPVQVAPDAEGQAAVPESGTQLPRSAAAQWWARARTPGQAAFPIWLTRLVGGLALTAALAVSAAFIVTAVESRLDLPVFAGQFVSFDRMPRTRSDQWLPRIPSRTVLRVDGLGCPADAQLAGALLQLHIRLGPANGVRELRVYRPDTELSPWRFWQPPLMGRAISEYGPLRIEVAPDQQRRCMFGD